MELLDEGSEILDEGSEIDWVGSVHLVRACARAQTLVGVQEFQKPI